MTLIVKNGWTIKYLVGDDAHGKYLDYYSEHRMTNDVHERLREDGSRESLPVINTIHKIYLDDAQKTAREAQRVARRNRKVMKILEEKGFGTTGEEGGSYQINHYLARKFVEENE